jgi:hypothetical protein
LIYLCSPSPSTSPPRIPTSSLRGRAR